MQTAAPSDKEYKYASQGTPLFRSDALIATGGPITMSLAFNKCRQMEGTTRASIVHSKCRLRSRERGEGGGTAISKLVLDNVKYTDMSVATLARVFSRACPSMLEP